MATKTNTNLKEDAVPPTGRKPIFVDIRRYFCDYCGISRSKKSLLTTHLLSHHKGEMEKLEEEGNGEVKSNTCEECGVAFRKPAYLKQHMRSHSVEILGSLRNENLCLCMA